MVTLGILSDFLDDERAKLEGACVWVNRAIADQRFIKTLKSASFTSTGLDNDAVIALLSKPVTITRLYCEYLGWYATRISKTIAEEEPDGTVTFNRPFFDQQSIPSLANTLFHEFLHCLGLRHVSAHDYSSWPYQGGDLMESFVKRLMNEASLPSFNTALAHGMAADEEHA